MNEVFLIGLIKRTFIIFFEFKDFIKEGVCCKSSVGEFILKYNWFSAFGCPERHGIDALPVDF